MPYNFGVQYDEINYKLYEYLLWNTFATPKSKIEQSNQSYFTSIQYFSLGCHFTYIYVKID